MSDIVVVDDDFNIRNMLVAAFKAKGHRVSSAMDGQEGLDVVRREHPDLILLDLNMPRMDGYQVLDVLRADRDLKAIPVIILTASDARSDIVEGLQRGANDYITKPFNLAELLARTHVQIRMLELEQTIRRSEAYHRALFESASDPEMVLDGTGRILRVNDAATALLGIDEDGLIDTEIVALVSPEDHPEFELAFSGAFEGSDMPIFEIHLALPGGTKLPVDADLYGIDIEGVRQLLLHLRDIRRRKAAETRSDMIFEYIGDGIFITDQDGFIVLASRSAARLAGCSHDEIIGLDITGFHSRDGLTSWQKATAQTNGEACTYEDRLPQSGGAPVPVEWTVATFTVASETYSIGVARDLTDRKQADERRMEAERLKTLLEIAGGAAHEINQPLTAILGYAEMSMDLLEQDHPTREYQDHVASAALRINEILKRMQAVKEYRTRPYADGHQIVDFERSAETREGDD